MFHMEIQPLLSWVVGFKLNRLQSQVADVFEPGAFSLWMRWVWLAKLLKRESREENWTKELFFGTIMEQKFEWGLTKRWDREDKGLTHEWNLCGVANHLCTNQGILEWDEEFQPFLPGTKQEIFFLMTKHLNGISVGLTPLKSREMKRSEQESTLTSRTWERDALIDWRKRGFWEHCIALARERTE